MIMALVMFFSLGFVLISDLSLMTFCLLMNMLMMILLIFFFLNFHWISLLYGITVISGLMVIFAYISSVSPKNPMVSTNKIKFLFIYILLFLIFSIIDFFMPMEKDNLFFHKCSYNDSILIFESLFLFSLLFFLVVLYLRFTYSKGGGFRKKF